MPRLPKSRHQYRDVILSDQGPRSATARLVALALTKFMNAKTFESFVGAERLGASTALTERTVRKALACLVGEGFLIERNKERGRDFWLKIRTAVLPDRVDVAEEYSASQDRHPEAFTGSQQGNGEVPEDFAGLPENGARLAEEKVSTGGRKRPRLPENSSADPVSDPESYPEYKPVSDPEVAASPSPVVTGSAARRNQDPDAPIMVSDPRLRAKIDGLRNAAKMRPKGARP